MEYKALIGTQATFGITGFRLLTVDQLRCFVSAVIPNETLVELTISELRILSPVGKTITKHKNDSVAAIAHLARLIRDSKKLKRLVISTTDFSYGHDISPILGALKTTKIDTIEFHGCGFNEDQEPVLQGLLNQQLSRDHVLVFTTWWSDLNKTITPLIPSGGIIGLLGYWMNE
jgi:hypothetical protein